MTQHLGTVKDMIRLIQYMIVMELRQLRYVDAVARHRHFTRAAANAGIAQPALSHQIKRLELELGVELFHRSRAGVRLTPAGEAFLPHVRRALLDIDAGREELSAMTGLRVGRVRLGAMQALGELDLAKAIAEFHQSNPGIEINLIEESTAQMHADLIEGQLDLALIAVDLKPPEELEAIVLSEEPVLIALERGHRLAGRKSIRFEELRDEPFVVFRSGTGLRFITERAASAAGFEPSIAFETANLERMLALVSEGLGVAVVPQSTVRHSHQQVSVVSARPALSRTVGLAWRGGHPITPAVRALRDLFVQVSG